MVCQGKEFSLEAVLCITTGRLVASIDELRSVQDYLASCCANISTARFDSYLRDCVLKQHPQLKEILCPDWSDIKNKSERQLQVKNWTNQQKQKFGKSVILRKPKANEVHGLP